MPGLRFTFTLFCYFVLRCGFVVVLLLKTMEFHFVMWGPHNGDPFKDLFQGLSVNQDTSYREQK